MEWANDSVEKKNEENETGVKHETGQKLCGTISYRAGIWGVCGGTSGGT